MSSGNYFEGKGHSPLGGAPHALSGNSKKGSRCSNPTALPLHGQYQQHPSGANVRRSSAAYQPISFITSSDGAGGSGAPYRRDSGSGYGDVRRLPSTPRRVLPLPQGTLVSPASDRRSSGSGSIQLQQQRRAGTSPSSQGSDRLQLIQQSPSLLHRRSSSKGFSLSEDAPCNNNHATNKNINVAEDSFTIGGGHWAQFTPPSSSRGGTEDHSDNHPRQRSGHHYPKQQQYHDPQQQQPTRQQQNGPSTRDLLSPSVGGPTFVDASGHNTGGPQRTGSSSGQHASLLAQPQHRKTASTGTTSAHSDECWCSPHSRSKSFSEGFSVTGASGGGGGGGGGGAAGGGGGRREGSGSSLEASGRPGSSSFSASPSMPLPRRDSVPAAGSHARLLERRESSWTLNSRLSSPGFSHGFGSPASLSERSLARTGGARTPRYGESGGTTPRALSFQRGRAVGSGGFGTVFQAILSDGTLAAVKELKLETSNLKAIDREVHTMSSLPPHPNCVRYFGSRHSKNHYYIIMEYISGGSISSLRQSVGRFRESVFQRYTYMVLLGLEHLHENGIIHRDIKGANVLLDERGCAKIVDFGCCKDLNQGTQTIGGGGTPLWMAPEVCRGETATAKSDVWAFGCLCLEMTNDTGLPWTFPSTMTLQGVAYALASARNPPPIPSTLSEMARDFVACCLRLDPEERLGVTELLNHPFFDLDYCADDDSEDELIVSREASARQSAVKRMMKNVQENGEGVLVNLLKDAEGIGTDTATNGGITATTATGKVKKKRSAATNGSSSVNYNSVLSCTANGGGISFNTGLTRDSTGTTTAEGGAVVAAAGAGGQHHTVNIGFHLAAVDEDDDEEVIGGNGRAVVGSPAAPTHCNASERQSFVEDADYMATVNDIITRARKSSHGMPPNARSSTATGGHATATTNRTSGSSAHNGVGAGGVRVQSNLCFSSSSSTYSSDNTASSSISSYSSSSPHLASSSAVDYCCPSDLDYKAPATRRVYRRGHSPEPESVSPREPEGGTKPHPDRVIHASATSSATTTAHNHSGRNTLRTSATQAGEGKAFQRRATFPMKTEGSNNTQNSSSSSCATSSSARPPDGLKPGGPSRVQPAEPPIPQFPSSGGVSKARSAANAPTTKKNNSISTKASTNSAGAVPLSSSRGDTAVFFSSGSQGCVLPARRVKSGGAGAASGSSAAASGARGKTWETGGHDRLSKEFSSTLKDVRDIISFTREDEETPSSTPTAPAVASNSRVQHGRKEILGSSGSGSGDKRRTTLAKWFSSK